MRIVTCAIVVVLLSGLLPPALWSQETSTAPPKPSPPIYITVRIRPDVKPETLDYLARVTQPETVEVERGWNLRAILRRFYGFSFGKLRRLVSKANPELSKAEPVSGELRQIQLPAGVKGSANVTITPQRPITLKQFALAEMGSGGEKTRTAIEDANPSLKGHWNSVVTQKVRFPYTTAFATYRMRTGSPKEAEDIVQTLKERDQAVQSAEAARGLFEVVPHWSLAGASQGPQCPSAKDPPGWPLQTLPSDWSEANHDARIWPAVIGIVDTGIPQGDTRFVLWDNPAPGRRGTTDPNGTQCTNDVCGCNFLNPASFPEDDCRLPDAYNHGTHIAGLASGRLYTDSAELDRRIQLMILKAADVAGQITQGAVANAIEYAFVRGAHIINLSVTGPASSELKKTISTYENMLYVAAAGNPHSGIGIDLDDQRLTSDTGFPARYTKLLENVISVASHDGQGRLSCFSNFGKDSVDLAASGSNVDSTVSGQQTRVLSGTSQATALVSLAAALLYSRGLTVPEAIKHRILAATDFEPQLRDKVSSEGKLNIAKALDYRRDIVQYQGGRVVAGEILSPLKISVPSRTNDLSLRGEVYKIVMGYSNEPGKKIRVTVLQAGRLVHLYCDSIGKITFKTGFSSNEIPLEQVSEIIPRQSGSGSSRPP
jgi:hypothetical protein